MVFIVFYWKSMTYEYFTEKDSCFYLYIYIFLNLNRLHELIFATFLMDGKQTRYYIKGCSTFSIDRIYFIFFLLF